MRAKHILLPALVAGLLPPATAHAQGVDIEVPVLILEEVGQETVEDSSIDLANIVQSAAKGVTTVQEAPAIVTVITADEIRNRGYTTLEDAFDSVPGYMKLGALHNQFPFPLTRGILQATMFAVNGISMFDPWSNVPSVGRVAPMETIKRIEFVTGPGGVLWGANSYLGIMNVITKDASDVDGVEADIGVGSGNGGRDVLRGYVMTGIDELWSDDSSLFLHAAFDTWIEPGYEMPYLMFAQPLPNPNSRNIYGPLVRASPERSFLFNFDGKLSIGNLDVHFSVPVVDRKSSVGFNGLAVRKDYPEDDFRRDDGSLECDPNNPPDPVFSADDRCTDVLRTSRNNDLNWFDRTLIAEYRTRIAEGKAGFTFKGYGAQFVRDFPQLGISAPLPGVTEGGVSFGFTNPAYRAGGLIDGDIELPSDARLLYGVEGYYEWIPADSNSRSVQGPGRESVFFGPYQLERLPVACPRQRQRDADGNLTGGTEFVPGCPLTIIFETSRTVLGAYLNPQWKLTRNLTLDAGARIQVSPEELGDVGYDLEPLFSGALVYGFAKDWHLKLNYAEGFRAPVFNNLVSNGEGVQVDGSFELKNERSQSGQGEINARLFKGERRIREVNFRANYSYTKLENLIQITGGRYANTGDRGIHSAEFLGKLFVQGGHELSLAYTWLQISTADKGRLRVLPEHWFHLNGIYALSENFVASTGLRVAGANEDANRLIDYRQYSFDAEGRVMNNMTNQEGQLVVFPHEVVMDRIPAAADLTLGLAYTGIDRLRLSAFAYNAFNGRNYQPDAFADYEPRLEFMPNPAKDFRFRIHATYTY